MTGLHEKLMMVFGGQEKNYLEKAKTMVLFRCILQYPGMELPTSQLTNGYGCFQLL
jgi:hypothetical protein